MEGDGIRLSGRNGNATRWSMGMRLGDGNETWWSMGMRLGDGNET